jgi:predicted RNase H-like HicB family nuclease
MRKKNNVYTAIIKKSGKYYVALCLELNVCSQGESIEEAKEMLKDAIYEYLSYMKEEGLEKEINPVSLSTLKEFLLEDIEVIKPAKTLSYSENFSLEVTANV